jgi:hypothetical protein
MTTLQSVLAVVTWSAGGLGLVHMRRGIAEGTASPAARRALRVASWLYLGSFAVAVVAWLVL